MKTMILIVATTLLLVSAAFAQGSIEGTITDAKGKGVANVSVTVVGADGKAVATGKTDASGAYTFDGVASGKYKVVATTASGYKAAFRDDIRVEDDNATTVDITLVAAVQAPVPTPTAKPAPKATAQPQQPGINVRIGQKFSVVTETKSSNISQVMGQEVEASMTSNSTVIYEVIAVEPDSITLRGTISSLRVEALAMGQETTFDSSRKDNIGPLAETLEPEMRRVRTVTISRSGQIRKEDEPWKTDVSSSQGSGANKVGSVELFEPELTLPELKAQAVIPFTGNPPTSRSGKYFVGATNGGTTNVSYRGNGQSTGMMEQMGVEMETQSTWTERAELQIDAASRVLLSRETTKEGDMVIKASGTDVPVKRKETINQKVTRLN